MIIFRTLCMKRSTCAAHDVLCLRVIEVMTPTARSISKYSPFTECSRYWKLPKTTKKKADKKTCSVMAAHFGFIQAVFFFLLIQNQLWQRNNLVHTYIQIGTQ